MNKHGFVANITSLSEVQGAITDADFSKFFKSERIGIHHVILPPNSQSSLPHAESLEEEFVYVLKGTPHAWIQGHLYQLKPGLAVAFPCHNPKLAGIAHAFYNNSTSNVELLVLGEKTKPENKCYFPLNIEMKLINPDFWWNDAPILEKGPHDGKLGNLNHLEPWENLEFIKDVHLLPHEGGKTDYQSVIRYCYPDCIETFSNGVRLTNIFGLKNLAVCHEILTPGKRGSWSHAHQLEEEFAFVLKGQLTLWLDGETQIVNQGDCIYFHPGSGICHSIFNETNTDVEFLMIGETAENTALDKIFYHSRTHRNEQCATRNRYWAEKDSKLGVLKNPGFAIQKNFEIKAYLNFHEFLEGCQNTLYEFEAENSLMLGLVENELENENSNFQYFSIQKYEIGKTGTIIGAAVITQVNLILTRIPEPFVYELARFFVASKIDIPGIVGPAPAAEAIAKYYEYFELHKNFENLEKLKPHRLQKIKLNMKQNIFINSAVTPIDPSKISNGKIMNALPIHLDLIAGWISEFYNEANPNSIYISESVKSTADNHLKLKNVFIWVNEFDEPTSMSISMRPTKNGISIGYVYTPKHFRKLGYASNLVAAQTKLHLDTGKKFCVLYTDANFPTSNKIYEGIGYKKIMNSRHYLSN